MLRTPTITIAIPGVQRLPGLVTAPQQKKLPGAVEVHARYCSERGLGDRRGWPPRCAGGRDLRAGGHDRRDSSSACIKRRSGHAMWVSPAGGRVLQVSRPVASQVRDERT